MRTDRTFKAHPRRMTGPPMQGRPVKYILSRTPVSFEVRNLQPGGIVFSYLFAADCVVRKLLARCEMQQGATAVLRVEGGEESGGYFVDVPLHSGNVVLDDVCSVKTGDLITARLSAGSVDRLVIGLRLDVAVGEEVV